MKRTTRRFAGVVFSVGIVVALSSGISSKPWATNENAAKSAPKEAAADLPAGSSDSPDASVVARDDSSHDELALADAGAPMSSEPAQKAGDGAVVTTIAPPATAVSNVSQQPGVADDSFVGAAADAKVQTCVGDAASWKVKGSVTNPTGAKAKYRIYVALNKAGTTETKALQQVNVELRAGATQEWETTADVVAKDLICILRVERTSASSKGGESARLSQ